VELRAFLAQTTIRLNELLALQPGDIITTEKEAGREMLVQVEGRNKFLGQIGQYRGGRAIQITRLCQQIPDAVAIEKPSDEKPPEQP
jgi:flagellar motor switch protein FliM